jgi:lipopolysaccharide heptosyltransferase II
VKKILIVEVNWIGDILFTTPFIRAVREANPGSHIACLVHPRCREMLESNPRIDEIIVYDEEGAHKGLAGKASLVLALGAKKFDAAFLLHRSFTKALIAYLAGIRERVGYPTKKRAWLLTRSVEEPEGPAHKVEYFLDIARAAGISARDISYEFFASDADRGHVARLLAGSGIGEPGSFAVICPGGNWGPKRWAPESFAALGDRLAERHGLKVVLAAAEKDARLAREVAGMMRSGPVVAAGRTTLGQLGALLERAAIVVAGDTGPMHMAVAMKARTIALFGPTDPAITGPYGAGNYRVMRGATDCEVPCYDVTCKDNRCMRGISVEEVAKVAEEMLGV